MIDKITDFMVDKVLNILLIILIPFVFVGSCFLIYLGLKLGMFF